MAGLPGSVIPPAAETGTVFVMKRLDAVLMAKNLDGPVGDGYLFINKRGVDKEAFGTAGASPLRWRSKYGSVTFNQFGREFPLGGLNEAGLAVEELSGPAAYPAADARPALNELQWIQYQLDNHDSVKDVLKSDAELRISKLLFNLHYLVADRKGRVAVIEFVAGKMVAYIGETLTVPVLANNDYAESVRNLGFHRHFGGDRPVPSGPGSAERFVRAAASLREYGWLGRRPFVDDAFVVLKSVDQDNTQWSVAYNLPRRVVFFKTRAHRRYKIVRLDGFDFSCRTPALMLPVGTEASWDLAGDFKPYDPDRNRSLLEDVFKKLVAAGEMAAPPPADLVGKLAAYPDSCLCGRKKK
jgi:penicillin V acylase-like amidase (Ntn superfamily)